jgi:hypothetical protein
MHEQIGLRELEPHQYAVEITEGEDTTHHRVVGADRVIEDLELAAADETELVRQAVKALLDRVKVTELPHVLDLPRILDGQPGLGDELLARLTG